jgi:hypothetical protein
MALPRAITAARRRSRVVAVLVVGALRVRLSTTPVRNSNANWLERTSGVSEEGKEKIILVEMTASQERGGNIGIWTAEAFGLDCFVVLGLGAAGDNRK